MSVVRIGLIGCGNIAQTIHLPVLRRLPGVAVIALAEPDPQRREGAHRQVPTAQAYVQYHDLLAMPAVEAVVICVPTALHAEVTLAALQHRKQIYLEKPLATDLDEARRVVTAWRAAGVIGMIGFNYRFSPLYQSVRELVQRGTLGTLVGMRSVFATTAKPLPSWKKTRDTGGGVLLDLASHHIDLLHFLFAQDIYDVFTQTCSQQSENDTAVMQFRLSSGLFVQAFFSLTAVEEDRLEIYGTAKKLAVDRYRSSTVEIFDSSWGAIARLKGFGRSLRSALPNRHLINKLCSPGHEPSYRTALAHFVLCVRTQTPASPDFHDGYRSQVVIAAAEESAKTGKTVSITEEGEYR